MTHTCNDKCSKPTYDPKVGWSSLTSVTGGTMPTYDEFSDRFYTVCADSDNLFAFGNDKRVGTDKLRCSDLWDELNKAYREWVYDDTPDDGESDTPGWVAYNWCSSVLGILGWEWVLHVRKTNLRSYLCYWWLHCAIGSEKLRT
jgi:hypothetical protein